MEECISKKGHEERGGMTFWSAHSFGRMVLLSVALVAPFFFLRSVASAESENFSLSPLFQEVTLSDSSGEWKGEITLSNETASDALFSILPLDIGTLDESGGVAFLGGDGDFERRYGLASWIRLSTDRVLVPAHSKEVIPVTLENKESLSPGGHYGAVSFEIIVSDTKGESEKRNVSVRSSFATLFFVKKTGGEVVRLEYRGLNEPIRDAFGIPDRISLRFQNLGNVHAVPRGIIRVTDPLGRVIREGRINEESAKILPESYRVFGVALSKRASAFLPGKYSIHIDYRFDGEDAFRSATERVLLWRVNLLWVVAFGFLMFLLRSFWRKRKIK